MTTLEQLYNNFTILLKRQYEIEERIRRLELELAVIKKPNLFQRVFINTALPRKIKPEGKK
jgi:hypothetical protein